MSIQMPVRLHLVYGFPLWALWFAPKIRVLKVRPTWTRVRIFNFMLEINTGRKLIVIDSQTIFKFIVIMSVVTSLLSLWRFR